MSTGVGGGIIANGEMVTGNGHAGEVGHITVRPGGDRCNVGCDGCFEGNASGPAIARNALQRWYFVPEYQCVRVSGDSLAMRLEGNGVKLVGENEVVGKTAAAVAPRKATRPATRL